MKVVNEENISLIDPNDCVISRRRKKYKFAQFALLSNCFEIDQWQQQQRASCYSVEIGAGTGYFSVELARRYPDKHYVAIDVKADRLQSGAKRALAQSITNISFVRAPADRLLDLFSVGTVGTIWLTFSDPFPKKAQAKHRLTHPTFLSSYRRLLHQEGNLCMKTDNHGLFDWSIEQLVSDGWRIHQITYDLHTSDFDDDTKVITTFEDRFTRDGLPIYALFAKC